MIFDTNKLSVEELLRRWFAQTLYYTINRLEKLREDHSLEEEKRYREMMRKELSNYMESLREKINLNYDDLYSIIRYTLVETSIVDIKRGVKSKDIKYLLQKYIEDIAFLLGLSISTHTRERLIRYVLRRIKRLTSTDEKYIEKIRILVNNTHDPILLYRNIAIHAPRLNTKILLLATNKILKISEDDELLEILERASLLSINYEIYIREQSISTGLPLSVPSLSVLNLSILIEGVYHELGNRGLEHRAREILIEAISSMLLLNIVLSRLMYSKPGVNYGYHELLLNRISDTRPFKYILDKWDFREAFDRAIERANIVFSLDIEGTVSKELYEWFRVLRELRRLKLDKYVMALYEARLGYILSVYQRLIDSYAYFNHVLDVARDYGDSLLIALMCIEISKIYDHLGDPVSLRQALEYLDKALYYSEILRYEHSIALIYHGKGRIISKINELGMLSSEDSGTKYLVKARNIYEKLKDKMNYVEALIAEIIHSTKIEPLEKVKRLIEIDEKYHEYLVIDQLLTLYHDIAYLSILGGDIEVAESYTKKIEKIIESNENLKGYLHYLYELKGLLHEKKNNMEKAVEYYMEAVKNYESHVISFSGLYGREKVFYSRLPLYERILNYYSKLNDNLSLLTLLSWFKARSIYGVKEIDKRLLEKISELYTTYWHLSNALTLSLGSPSLLEITRDIRDRYWRLKDLFALSGVKIEIPRIDVMRRVMSKMQKVISGSTDEKWAIIDYFLDHFSRKLYTVVARHDGHISAFRFEISSEFEKFISNINEWHIIIDESKERYRYSGDYKCRKSGDCENYLLDKILFPRSIRELVYDADTLIISPHSILSGLNFNVIVLDGKHLLEQYNIVITYNLYNLIKNLMAGASINKKALIIVNNDELGYADREFVNIHKILSDNGYDIQALWSDAFSDEIIGKYLLKLMFREMKPGLIYFITHSVYRRSFLESYVKLNKFTILPVFELMNMLEGIDNYIAILSSCESARSLPYASEPSGFPATFFWLGARSVLGTYIKVEDAELAKLMPMLIKKHFEEEIPLHAALREVSLEKRQYRRHPAYWAFLGAYDTIGLKL